MARRSVRSWTFRCGMYGAGATFPVATSSRTPLPLGVGRWAFCLLLPPHCSSGLWDFGRVLQNKELRTAKGGGDGMNGIDGMEGID